MFKNIQKFNKTLAIIALLTFGLSGAIFLFGNNVLAQSQYGQEYVAETGLATGDPRVIAVNIIRVALGFLALVAVAIVIYGGWLYMTSEGNEEKINKAKSTLKNAGIGLLIILSSFAIVSWILGLMGGGGSSRQSGPGGSIDFQRGFAAIGSCIVDTVYPENFQNDVPRNTSIIITFKEEIDPTTICDLGDNPTEDQTCTGEKLLTDNIKIFKQIQKDNCVYDAGGVCDLVTAKVYTNDNKTFVFVPTEYFGSATGDMWYEVYMDNDIQLKESGDGAFDDCRADYMNWQFEVSNKLDLTPPQVKNVFPPADNWQDENYDSGDAVQATGEIVVNSIPLVDRTAKVSDPVDLNHQADPNAPEYNAHVEGTYTCPLSGTINISIGDDVASISGGPANYFIENPEINKNNPELNYINLGCGLTLISEDGEFVQGSLFGIDLEAATDADILTIGKNNYRFIEGESNREDRIQIADNLEDTINNIMEAINSSEQVDASRAGNTITLTAKIAGDKGNDILLLFGNSNAINITKMMSGGQDQETGNVISGLSDQPKNAVVQVNFNEPVFPITVSGEAEEVSDYIKVVNADQNAKANGGACANNNECLSFNCNSGICEGNYLLGEFRISNLYQTVEFIPRNACGTNACGGTIYCLPDNSNIKVEINAARLNSCTGEDCLLKTPYTICGNVAGGDQVCQDQEGNNFPGSEALTGVMDVCFNSLDGNKNNLAEGPFSQSGKPAFNENNLLGLCDNKVCTKDREDSVCGVLNCTGASFIKDLQQNQGDDYQWSFFISDEMLITPPMISSENGLHDPGIKEEGVSLVKPVLVNFDRLLLSSSLHTGSSFLYDKVNDTYVEHQNVNLWNYTNTPLGYWIVKNEKESGIPDGYPDYTQVEIRHSMFFDAETYRAQLGSGINDIYQNCFFPCGSDNCTPNPSCYNGNQFEQ